MDNQGCAVLALMLQRIYSPSLQPARALLACLRAADPVAAANTCLRKAQLLLLARLWGYKSDLWKHKLGGTREMDQQVGDSFRLCCLFTRFLTALRQPTPCAPAPTPSGYGARSTQPSRLSYCGCVRHAPAEHVGPSLFSICADGAALLASPPALPWSAPSAEPFSPSGHGQPSAPACRVWLLGCSARPRLL